MKNKKLSNQIKEYKVDEAIKLMENN